MAMTTVKAHCSLCDEKDDTYECKGCSTIFCFKHLKDHRETINKEFIEIGHNSNSFRQTLIDQKNDPKKRPLIQEIDKWEEDSINQIKQTANQCRQRLIKYTNKFIIEIENKLNNLSGQLEQIGEKNKFNEIDLDQFKEKLTKLTEELDKPPNVRIEQESTSFINKISLILPFDLDTKWKQFGITVAGGNGRGNQLNQLSLPQGIFIDDDQTIHIADDENDRIVAWKCNAKIGQIIAGGNGKGNETNQLNLPRDVIIDKENNSLIISDWENKRIIQWSRQNNTNGQIIISNINCYGLTMDKNGYLYIADCEKNEVRRYNIGDEHGTIVAGGNGRGNHLNQLNYPTFIFIDEDYSLYVSDRDNDRVMKWIEYAQEGIVVAGGNGEGNSLTQLSRPYGVIVDQLGQIYVAEWDNHRVMRWCKGAKEGTIIVGGNGGGAQSNQLNGPIGLSFDREGNLYVVDCGNDRIQKFEID